MLKPRCDCSKADGSSSFFSISSVARLCVFRILSAQFPTLRRRCWAAVEKHGGRRHSASHRIPSSSTEGGVPIDRLGPVSLSSAGCNPKMGGSTSETLRAGHDDRSLYNGLAGRKPGSPRTSVLPTIRVQSATLRFGRLSVCGSGKQQQIPIRIFDDESFGAPRLPFH